MCGARSLLWLGGFLGFELRVEQSQAEGMLRVGKHFGGTVVPEEEYGPCPS